MAWRSTTAAELFEAIISEWYDKKVFTMYQSIDLANNTDEQNLQFVNPILGFLKDKSDDGDVFIWAEWQIEGHDKLCVRDTIFDIRREDSLIYWDFKRLAVGLKVLQQLLLGNDAVAMYQKGWSKFALGYEMTKENCLVLCNEAIDNFKSNTYKEIKAKIRKGEYLL